MMSEDSQSEEPSPKTKKNSAGIIEDTSAMLPVEMWEKIFEYTEYRDVYNLKVVSQHFNAIATRVAKMKYKWYELCREVVPERHWCEILKWTQHPVNDRIRCENFHAEKEYKEIWKFLHATWIGWSRVINKQSEVQELSISNQFVQHNLDSNVTNFAAIGNTIVARFNNGDIYFYGLLRPRPLSKLILIPCVYNCHDIRLSKKGADLIGTFIVEHTVTREWTMLWLNTAKGENVQFCFELAHAAFACDGSGYTCSIKTYDWQGGIGCEVRTLPIHPLRRPFHLRFDTDEVVFDVQVYGDTLILLTRYVSRNNVKLYKISIQENQLKETYDTSLDANGPGTYMILKPFIAAYFESRSTEYSLGFPPDLDTSLGFSVSGREWKLYNAKKELKLEAPVNDKGVAYEGGVLVLMMLTGNIHIIYVDDPDHFDSKLEAMPSRMVTLHWNNPMIIAKPFFAKYNSEIYLYVANFSGEPLKVLKFR